MTAHAMEGDREMCLNAGMDDYITKPLKKEELFEALARAATRRAGRVRPGGSPTEGDPVDEAPAAPKAPGGELDFDSAITRVGGDMDLFREIAEVFLGDCPNQLARIASAIENGDADALRSSAHSLKGAVGNFGADAAWETALQLEEIGKEGRLEEAALVHDDLKRTVEQLVTALRAM